MLIDSHAHLDAPYFRNRLPAVLDRAKKAGVERVITIGVTPSSSRNCIKIAEKYPLVFAAAGYHPHWADGSDPERLAQAERLAKNPSVVALGEVGLDYHHFHSSKQNQIKLFRHMLEIAVTTRLPVIIHDRKASVDVYEILCAFQAKLAGGIIHCFSGDWNLAKKYLDWGFYLSIPGPVTYPRSRDLREVAQKAPLEHLLIETDAPHLTPAPRKGRKNEPAFIRYTALEIAALRNIALEEVADVTSRNVLQAFNLPP
ncbi:MAG: TatD family hydrolase [Desulfobacterales bacterium]